ncbi:MAG TPA: universal stress protein [Ktedonobacteraceae bacterium]
MFKRILLPVDGSPLAERALPLAARLAQVSGGTVILLRTVSWIDEALSPSPADLTDLAEAERYLSSLTLHHELKYVKTEMVTQTGEVASTILAVAHAHHADVITLCSHGSTGMTRWILGSVALKVSKHSLLPVLVLREGESGASLLHLRSDRPLRALMALDGSPFAEAALAPTAQLLTALSIPPIQAELHLLRVVKLPSEVQLHTFHQRYGVDMHDLKRREAEHYLRTTAEQLSSEITPQPGLHVKTFVIEGKDIAEALIQVALSKDPTHRYDLLAITTHGRSGLQRWVLGSIAERVLAGTRLPLFIVRPPEGAVTAGPVRDT